MNMRAEGGTLWLADDVALNPQRAAGAAVVTHASRVGDAVESGSAIVPEPLTYALASRDRATVVSLEREFELAHARARFLATGAPAGVQLALDFGAERATVVTGIVAPTARIAPCTTLVLDASYGLPIYRWPARDELADTLRIWVQANADAGRAAVLEAEPADEARQLFELAVSSAVAHEAVAPFVPQALRLDRVRKSECAGRLVLVPQNALDGATRARIGPCETALASGRMRVRGTRRRLAIDRGLVLSSRMDWPGLLRAVDESGASKVRTFGAHAEPLARMLLERGLDARPLARRSA